MRIVNELQFMYDIIRQLCRAHDFASKQIHNVSFAFVKKNPKHFVDTSFLKLLL